MSVADSLKELKDLDFAELDIQEIGVWPEALKAIILVLVFGLVMFLGYWLYIKDLWLERDRVVAEEATLLQQYQTKAFQAANLDAYKQQMVELNETFGALLKQLPKDTEVPGLLEDITEIAYGSGLSMQSISLQPERAKEYYVELPIKIEVSGGYHDFGTFVSGVAALPRIVTLHDFTVSETKGSLLKIEVEAKTYRYKSEGE